MSFEVALFDSPEVNLMASRNGLVHLDTLDLVKARSRTAYIKAAATELYVDADTIKKDVGRLLLQLETFHGDRLAQLKHPTATPVELTDQQRRQAIDLLQSPKLLQQIVADMDARGRCAAAFGNDRPVAVLSQQFPASVKLTCFGGF